MYIIWKKHNSHKNISLKLYKAKFLTKCIHICSRTEKNYPVLFEFNSVASSYLHKYLLKTYILQPISESLWKRIWV